MKAGRSKQGLSAILAVLITITLSVGARGASYVSGKDSLPQSGVQNGKVEKRTWDTSTIYPGVTSEYWIYVPAQYTDAEPACVIVFQDGETYLSADESMRAPVVLDNLIHQGEMPVTIGIFINPGMKEAPGDQRDNQYVPVNDTYARFLMEEILPEVGKDYNLVTDASGRAVVGMSDGGLSAFTAAWHRPDAFSKVISHIGSFTRLRGGAEYPHLVRLTRGNPKPIRVFQQDGENDLNGTIGNWPLANRELAAALKFARYDSKLVMGTGGHDLVQGGAILPDTLRWIWRDYPGVKGAGDPRDLNAVTGQWEVQVNLMGSFIHSVLTVTAQDGTLSATLHDDQKNNIPVTAISFENDILSYEYFTPPALMMTEKEGEKEAKAKAGKDKGSKGKSGKGKVGKESLPTMKTWVTVNGDTFEGALSSTTRSKIEWDFAVKGQRKVRAE